MKRVKQQTTQSSKRLKSSSYGLSLEEKKQNLLTAIRDGNLDAANQLLSFASMRNKAGDSDNLLLRTAAFHGHLMLVKQLLDLDHVKKTIQNNWNGILTSAFSGGHYDVIEYLIKIIKINSPTFSYYNFFKKAYEMKRVDIIKLLLEHTYIKELEVWIKFITWHGNIDALKLTLAFVDDKLDDKLDDKEALWSHALNFAASYGKLEIVEWLLSRYKTSNTLSFNKNQALKMAACNGHLEVVEHLLKLPEVSYNVASDSNLALRNAAKNGKLDIVKCLLKYPSVRALILAAQSEALFNALRYGHVEIVNEFLKIKMVCDYLQHNPNFTLDYAIRSGNLKLVNRILEFPTVKESVPAKSNNLLIVAIIRGNLDIVNRLLQLPSVYNSIENYSHKALSAAVEKNNIQIIKSLLNFASVQACLKNNIIDILDLAIKRSSKDVFNYLFSFIEVDNNIDNLALNLLDRAIDHDNFHAIVKLAKYPSVRNYFANQIYKSNYIFFRAHIAFGDLQHIDQMLKMPAIINYATKYPNALEIAARRGRLDVVNRLLAIPEIQNNRLFCKTALTNAIMMGHTQIVKRFIHIPFVREFLTDMELINTAIMYNHPELAAFLLNFAKDVANEGLIPDRHRTKIAETQMLGYSLVKAILTNEPSEIENQSQQDSILKANIYGLVNSESGIEPLKKILSYLPMMQIAAGHSPERLVSRYVDISKDYISKNETQSNKELSGLNL